MNTFQTIDTEYLRASRTIETVLVSKESLSKVFLFITIKATHFEYLKII
jgi:hypothetical protein